MTLTEKSLKELKNALFLFGDYTFFDKGPEEVIDIYSLATAFKNEGVDASIIAFQDILKVERYGEKFASAILYCLDDWDELWGAHQNFLETFL